MKTRSAEAIVKNIIECIDANQLANAEQLIVSNDLENALREDIRLSKIAKKIAEKKKELNRDLTEDEQTAIKEKKQTVAEDDLAPCLAGLLLEQFTEERLRSFLSYNSKYDDIENMSNNGLGCMRYSRFKAVMNDVKQTKALQAQVEANKAEYVGLMSECNTIIAMVDSISKEVRAAQTQISEDKESRLTSSQNRLLGSLLVIDGDSSGFALQDLKNTLLHCLENIEALDTVSLTALVRQLMEDVKKMSDNISDLYLGYKSFKIACLDKYGLSENLERFVAALNTFRETPLFVSLDKTKESSMQMTFGGEEKKPDANPVLLQPEFKNPNERKVPAPVNHPNDFINHLSDAEKKDYFRWLALIADMQHHANELSMTAGRHAEKVRRFEGRHPVAAASHLAKSNDRQGDAKKLRDLAVTLRRSTEEYFSSLPTINKEILAISRDKEKNLGQKQNEIGQRQSERAARGKAFLDASNATFDNVIFSKHRHWGRKVLKKAAICVTKLIFSAGLILFKWMYQGIKKGFGNYVNEGLRRESEKMVEEGRRLAVQTANHGQSSPAMFKSPYGRNILSTKPMTYEETLAKSKEAVVQADQQRQGLRN